MTLSGATQLQHQFEQSLSLGPSVWLIGETVESPRRTRRSKVKGPTLSKTESMGHPELARLGCATRPKKPVRQGQQN